MDKEQFQKYIELLCKILNVDPERKEAHEGEQQVKWQKIPNTVDSVPHYNSSWDTSFSSITDCFCHFTSREYVMISNIKHYLNRIWCALLNRQCCEACDCDIKNIYGNGKHDYEGLWYE